jgi:hypothetical protein
MDNATSGVSGKNSSPMHNSSHRPQLADNASADRVPPLASFLAIAALRTSQLGKGWEDWHAMEYICIYVK